MPNTTGTVSKFADTLITANETIGSSGGTNYSYTATYKPLYVESLKINYSIGATPYVATSSTDGTITGTAVTGTVTEAGVISLTFFFTPSTSVILDEYKAKGLLTKLLDFCCTENHTDVLGTGDGVEVSFTSASPISDVSQICVRFMINGFEYDAWADSDGNFVSPQVVFANSTINYSTGEISIEFVNPPDDGTDITLLWSSGVVGQDWVILQNQNTKNDSGTDAFSGLLLKEVVLRNNGESGIDNVMFGIREYQYTGGSLWNWCFNVYKTFNMTQRLSGDFFHNRAFMSTSSTPLSSTAYSSTSNNRPYFPTLPLRDNSSVKYWIISTKSVIKVIAKVNNSVYVSAYLGLGKRISSQSVYQSPTLAIGSAGSNSEVTYSSTANSFCAYPFNILGTGLVNGIFLDDSNSPNCLFNISANRSDWNLTSYTGTTLSSKKTKNNLSILYPVYLSNAFASSSSLSNNVRKTICQLDGTYLLLGQGVASEDTVTIDSDTYWVFQNTFRTTEYSYFCVKVV